MNELFSSVEKDNPKDKAISETLKLLSELFQDITEFNTHELKALSILQTDKYLSEMLVFYILNKKHVKRKYAKEILEAFEKCTRDSFESKNLLRKLKERMNMRY